MELIASNFFHQWTCNEHIDTDMYFIAKFSYTTFVSRD